MGGRGIALVTVAALAVVAGADAAVAQPKDAGGDLEVETAAKDPKVAKRWLVAGHHMMQRGSYLAARNRADDAKPQFENAATAFSKAIEAGDDVNIYFELASAEEKLGKLDAAVRHVRRVVDAKTGVRPDVAKRAIRKLEELLTKVGLVTLNIAPAGTSITLGGAELGTSPLPEPLVLIPGTYTLSFQADGFQPREAELKVDPGSETERVIELEPVKVIVEPVKPVVRDEVMHVDTPPPPTPSRLPLHVGAGITGAAAVGASIFGVLALRQHATFTAGSTSTSGREAARARGAQLSLLTDVSLATAAVGAGFTVYWYFYRYRRHSGHLANRPARDPVNNPAKLDAVPWVQPESAGVTIAGSF